MMKRILVIEREYGAGASAIAELAAKRLGWTLQDHALTEEIARLAKARPEDCRHREERRDPWLYRLAKVFWRGGYERSAQLLDSDTVLDADCLIKFSQRVIEQVAEAGNCVIVGRAAAYFLRERKDTYCVFLYASREAKFHRVLEKEKDEAKAIDLVDNVDKQRVEFIKHYFGADWPSRHLYHAMLNTEIGEKATTDIIVNLMDAANKREEARRP